MAALDTARTTNRSKTVDDLVGVINPGGGRPVGIVGCSSEGRLRRSAEGQAECRRECDRCDARRFPRRARAAVGVQARRSGVRSVPAANGDQAAEALLAVTDAQAADAKPALAKAYNRCAAGQGLRRRCAAPRR